MLIFNCYILLFLSIYFESSYGFHKYSLSTIINDISDNIGREGSQNEIEIDPLTSPNFLNTPLDHLNKTDFRVWRMLYFDNYRYYKTNGPIILYIGAEAPNEGAFPDFAQQLARETGGALFTNLHRYYGESYIEFPSIDYLSSKQSLADIAFLLRHLKASPWFETSKVVVVGGSYGGSLATWMRLLYPKLVDAAHASSAPLVIKADFPEYLQHCSDDLEQHCDPEDYESLKNRFERYDTLLKTGDLRQFGEEVFVCPGNDLQSLVNVYTVFEQLSGEVCRAVQYGDPLKIKHHCKEVNYLRKYPLFQMQCLPSFYDMLQRDKIELKSNKAIYLWIYQTCTEFGFFATLSSKDQIFTQNLPIQYFYARCAEMFGPRFGMESVERGVEESNKLYGGLNRNLTKVVFVNGDLDPWSRLSALEDLSPDAPAIVIPGVAHCRDLHPAYGNPDVIKAQELSKKIIKKWIGL